MEGNIILRAALVLIPMLLSLTVHEFAHAWSAHLLGDDTAKLNGRMTLNPIPHIDLFGTLILPIILIVSNAGIFFGWAKPVPIMPHNFSHKVSMKTGTMITAAAGPTANVALAFLCLIIMKIALIINFTPRVLFVFLYYTISINIVLFLFNLIPFPPLDGSKVLVGLLPDKFGSIFDYIEKNPWIYMVGLFVIIYFADILIGGPYRIVMSMILNLFGINM